MATSSTSNQVCVALPNFLRTRRTNPTFITTPTGQQVHPDVWHRCMSRFSSGRDAQGYQEAIKEVEDLYAALVAIGNNFQPQPVAAQPAAPKLAPLKQAKDLFAQFLETGNTELIKNAQIPHAVFVKKYRAYSFVNVAGVFGTIVHGKRMTAAQQPYSKVIAPGLSVEPGTYVLVDDGKVVSKAYKVDPANATLLAQTLASLFRG